MKNEGKLTCQSCHEWTIIHATNLPDAEASHLSLKEVIVSEMKSIKAMGWCQVPLNLAENTSTKQTQEHRPYRRGIEAKPESRRVQIKDSQTVKVIVSLMSQVWSSILRRRKLCEKNCLREKRLHSWELMSKPSIAKRGEARFNSNDTGELSDFSQTIHHSKPQRL